MIIARSCIKPSLLRTFLFKGTWLGACGIFLIVASGTLLPYFLLNFLGFPLLISGFILIGIGLVPYRKLAKLQVNPYEISCENEVLTLFRDQKPQFKILINSLEKLDFLEKDKLYGVGVRLKAPMKGKVIACHPKVDLSPFVSHFPTYDLFLPYFTKSACEELEDYLD